MGDEEGIDIIEAPGIPGPLPEGEPGWHPSLNPTQKIIFDCEARFVLAYGERASGKTIGVLHALVRHAYENENALCLIIVGVKRQAEEGGSWNKLITQILPEWARGLGFDQDDPNNLFFTDPKGNSAKDLYMWIRNQQGGWSRVVLLSMPVEGHVKDRVKGMEASFIMVDEAQTLPSPTYFNDLVQQLGRNKFIPCQQIMYCCNPAGPSHWLYQRFFVLSVNKESGERDRKYAVYHVPISENRHNISEEYWETVEEAVKNDPVEYRRMVLGEWVDRPSGEAIFKTWWLPEIHIKGDQARGEIGLMPLADWPVQVGLDPGPANFSVSFEQCILTKSHGAVWLVFDELCYVGRKTIYQHVVTELEDRTRWWAEQVPGLRYLYIIDEAAITQPDRSGRPDATYLTQLSEGRLRFRTCPKGTNSVPFAVKLVADLLAEDRIYVSARCPKHIEMFNSLESEKVKEGKYDEFAGLRPKRSPHIHVFDSMRYPIMLHTTFPGRAGIRGQQEAARVYSW